MSVPIWPSSQETEVAFGNLRGFAYASKNQVAWYGRRVYRRQDSLILTGYREPAGLLEIIFGKRSMDVMDIYAVSIAWDWLKAVDEHAVGEGFQGWSDSASPLETMLAEKDWCSLRAWK